MQLVVRSHVAVGFHRSIEIGIVVEIAGQLVRVPFIDVWLHVLIPFHGAIVVAGVAGANAYAGKLGIFLQQFGHSLEVVLRSLIARRHIRLVEGSDRDHVQSVVLHIFHRCLDDLVPLFGVVGEDVHVNVHWVAVE